jgi:rhodanese-related sulfurtransferase
MSYAGDVTPAAAYAAVTGDPNAMLLDVRTRAEWTYVGVPDLHAAGGEVHLVEWSTVDGAFNRHFVDEVRAVGAEPGRPLYVICRSGVRSAAAASALTAAGLGPAFNVIEGFEGPPDSEGHQTVSGWKVAGLPWVQR